MINISNYKIDTINFGNFKKKESDKLPGAIRTRQCFSYMSGSLGNSFNDYIGLSAIIPKDEEIMEDSDNQIYVGKYGAVMDAYDLSGIDEDDFYEVAFGIYEQIVKKFPEYSYFLVPGKFPIGVDFNGKVKYSTHILYIDNYQDMIEKENSYQKVR